MKTINRYILASSLAAILTVTLFGGYSLNQYRANEVQEEHEKLEACIRTFWELLSHKGTDFRVMDGKLLVGNYPVNGNFELPDRVQYIFGGVATIFMGDVRVTTNVLDAEGKRAVGTRLAGPAYDAVFKQGQPYRGMATILGVPYLTAYDPIRDHNGEVIGVLFVGVKESEFLARVSAFRLNLAFALFGAVTIFTVFMVVLGRAMKRVEDANENHIKFQQTLIDTIPSPIFYKDAACRYLGCNKAFEAYVGFTQDELIGKTPPELWPAELADRYLHQDRAMFENPGTQVYETSVKYADGTLREVIFNKATFEGKGGVVAGLVGVILDITERKAAEAATKNANQQLLDIIEFLPDATFVVDKEKRVIAWNRAIEKMTGLKKEDILGKGDLVYSVPFYGEPRPILIDLIDEEFEVIERNYSAIKMDGRTLFAETYVPSFQNGDCRYFWGTATPLFDKLGNQVGGIESIRDITEYKQAVEEKFSLEAQLHHARLLETLMNRLGHDLKTPLTPLFIMLPLLKSRLVEPDLIKKVDMCIQSSKAIKNLADKAAILSRLSSTIKSHELEGVSLASIVGKALADCEDMICRKEILCRNSVDPVVAVHVVPSQIRELFVNLISNAVTFSPEKSVVVISAERNAEAVVVSVRDEGVGIAPAHLNHIFDEFFKADESRHELNSNGLGLSICKRIVNGHHGRIWVESPGIGKGTTIRFTLNEQVAAYNSNDYSI